MKKLLGLIILTSIAGLILLYSNENPSTNNQIEQKAKKTQSKSKQKLKQRVYSLTPNLNVRNKAGFNSNIITKIKQNIWYDVIERKKNWTKIILNSGKQGYVYNKHITDLWLLILKQERQIKLMQNHKALSSYPTALSHFNPMGDKLQLGDGGTPNGRFYLCELLDNPQPSSRYGAKSMRLSYPDLEDARRGLGNGLINKQQYLDIVKAIYKGKMPPQNTKLGGSLRIHGGGSSKDWTLGCIALDDPKIKGLYSKIAKRKLMAEVYQNEKEYQRYNDPLFINKMLIKAIKKMGENTVSYTNEAIQYTPLKYPMGDIKQSIGVCTDLVIRALRHANIDLQALLYEDILMNPHRYPTIKKANPNIDHRRVKNLKQWFDAHTKVLNVSSPTDGNSNWLPGDIVLFDTGVNNGTIYDHIGIVSYRKSKGYYLVRNLWTVGYKLKDMDLLNGDYPKIVGHYRFRQLLEYTSIPPKRNK